jgi:uncharacterized protein YceK
MKNRSSFLSVLVFTLIIISGCATAVPYSFAENDSGNGTATITFVSTSEKAGVDLHYFEGIELPIPENKTYWAPVIFPAGRPFTLTVNVYENKTDAGKERIFNCPALTAGNDYRLEVEIKAEKKFLGITTREREEMLILRDAKTKKIIYEQQL